MTTKEEEYVHYAECIESLSRAWLILQDLRVIEKKTAIHDAAFRFALVAYAKPYNRSDGIHRKGRTAYILPPPILPQEELALHCKILDLRKKVLAHSDLTLKDAKIYLSRYGGQANLCIGRNILPPLPDIDAVIQLIEHTLEIMYEEKSQLLESLVP